MFTDEPLRDFHRHDREMAEMKIHCFFCERVLQNERVFKIHDDYVCLPCLEEHYGEEV